MVYLNPFLWGSFAKIYLFQDTQYIYFLHLLKLCLLKLYNCEMNTSTKTPLVSWKDLFY
uniref:Uncharacterized protein n=1 Tax=Anguilla anguilla TaxID=7936 RepID=A0A0E9UG19_ANGAN